MPYTYWITAYEVKYAIVTISVSTGLYLIISSVLLIVPNKVEYEMLLGSKYIGALWSGFCVDPPSCTRWVDVCYGFGSAPSCITQDMNTLAWLRIWTIILVTISHVSSPTNFPTLDFPSHEDRLPLNSEGPP